MICVSNANVMFSLDVRQDAVEWPRDAPEVEGLHQEDGVPLLAVPHEAVQLFLERPGTVRGLLLVRPERAQLALLHEHALHSIRPHRPRELVLEVARAGVEPDALELATVGAPQRAQEMPLLADVVEPRESYVAVLPEEAWQVPVAAHRHDGDALRLEVAATATRKRLDGAAVARALDEPDGMERVLAEHGELRAFRTYQKQPAHRDRPLEEQLHGFMWNRKQKYAVLLVEALDLERVPRPLDRVLAHV